MKELHREYNHLYQQLIEKMNLKTWEVAAMKNKKGTGLAGISSATAIGTTQKADKSVDVEGMLVYRNYRLLIE